MLDVVLWFPSKSKLENQFSSFILNLIHTEEDILPNHLFFLDISLFKYTLKFKSVNKIHVTYHVYKYTSPYLLIFIYENT